MKDPFAGVSWLGLNASSIIRLAAITGHAVWSSICCKLQTKIQTPFFSVLGFNNFEAHQVRSIDV